MFMCLYKEIKIFIDLECMKLRFKFKKFCNSRIFNYKVKSLNNDI